MSRPHRQIAGVLALALCGCGAVSSKGGAPSDRIRDSSRLGLAAEAVAGPYAELDEYCADIRKDERKGKCLGSDREVEDGFEAPYEVVEILRVRGASGTDYCEIAIATDAGWWVTEELFICGEKGTDYEAEVINLELVWQKDSPPIVRAELRTQLVGKDGTLSSEELALCGVGDSGEVSCTRPFSRYEHMLHNDGDEEHRAVSLTLSRFGVIKVNGKALVDGQLKDVSGAYRIRFP